MGNNQIRSLLVDFLLKTRQRKIPWAFLNPSAIRWVKVTSPQPTTIILQKQTNSIIENGIPRRSETYVMTIQSPPNTSVNISTATDPDLLPVLREMFDEGTLAANDKTIEVLQGLLKDV